MDTGRMNAPSLSCRCAIARSVAVIVGEEIGRRLGQRHQVSVRRILQFKRRGEDKSTEANTVIASASEAIHLSVEEVWIASSLTLPCANALRLSQAMTGRQRSPYAPSTSFCILPP